MEVEGYVRSVTSASTPLENLPNALGSMIAETGPAPSFSTSVYRPTPHLQC